MDDINDDMDDEEKLVLALELLDQVEAVQLARREEMDALLDTQEEAIARIEVRIERIAELVTRFR